MWDSVPWLQAVAHWAFVIGIVAGAVALAAGAIVTVASNRAGAIATREASLKIEQARTKAAEADARAAEANKQAEEAKAETAKTNERLKKSQEMRRLTNEQRDALRPLLTSEAFQKEPKLNLRVTTVSDAEAESFATEIQSFLQSCEINIYPTDGGSPRQHIQLAALSQGLFLAVRGFENLEASQPFLQFQQIAAATGLDIGLTIQPDLEDRQAVLLVMRKPAS